MDRKPRFFVPWRFPEIVCKDAHIFDLGDDAVCDICGIPKSAIVDLERYRAEWAARLKKADDLP